MAALTKLRILIVEDHADTAESLSLLLRHSGATVEVSKDGFSCLSLLDEFRPDVILLDLALPGMDGLEVARTVSLRQRAPAIVALTGYADPQRRHQAAEAGIRHFLAKPYALRELIATLLDLQKGA